MTFEEVLPALRAGKWIRHAGLRGGVHFVLRGSKLSLETTHGHQLFKDGIVSMHRDDWEVMK